MNTVSYGYYQLCIPSGVGLKVSFLSAKCFTQLQKVLKTIRCSGGIISIVKVATTTREPPIRKETAKRPSKSHCQVGEREERTNEKRPKAKVDRPWHWDTVWTDSRIRYKPMGFRPKESDNGARMRVPRSTPMNCICLWGKLMLKIFKNQTKSWTCQIFRDTVPYLTVQRLCVRATSTDPFELDGRRSEWTRLKPNLFGWTPFVKRTVFAENAIG